MHFQYRTAFYCWGTAILQEQNNGGWLYSLHMCGKIMQGTSSYAQWWVFFFESVLWPPTCEQKIGNRRHEANDNRETKNSPEKKLSNFLSNLGSPRDIRRSSREVNIFMFFSNWLSLLIDCLSNFFWFLFHLLLSIEIELAKLILIPIVDIYFAFDARPAQNPH